MSYIPASFYDTMRQMMPSPQPQQQNNPFMSPAGAGNLQYFLQFPLRASADQIAGAAAQPNAMMNAGQSLTNIFGHEAQPPSLSPLHGLFSLMQAQSQHAMPLSSWYRGVQL